MYSAILAVALMGANATTETDVALMLAANATKAKAQHKKTCPIGVPNCMCGCASGDPCRCASPADYTPPPAIVIPSPPVYHYPPPVIEMRYYQPTYVIPSGFAGGRCTPRG